MAKSMEFLYPEKWLSKASTGDRVASELRMRIIAGELKAVPSCRKIN